MIHFITLTLAFVSLFLHSVGIYCLRMASRFSQADDTIFLYNLSATDIFYNIKYILLTMLINLNILSYTINVILERVQSCVDIPYFSARIFFTLQRFFQVYLNLHYRNCWFERWKGYMCIGTWLMFILLFVVVTIVEHFLTSGSFHKVFYEAADILSMVLSVIVVMLFVFVYGYLIMKALILRKNTHTSKTAPQKSCNDTRRLYIPFVMVFSFILLVIIPDKISYFHPEFGQYMLPFYLLCDISDAIVYLILKSEVRFELRKRLKELRPSFC